MQSRTMTHEPPPLWFRCERTAPLHTGLQVRRSSDISSAKVEKANSQAERKIPCALIPSHLSIFLQLKGNTHKSGGLYSDFTESQNHGMVGVGRDLCGSSSPTSLLKQGHLQQAAQDLVQGDLEYLQRRRIHDLFGQLVPVLRHPQSEEVLPHVQVELPVLQFVPTAPCPVAGHHWFFHIIED